DYEPRGSMQLKDAFGTYGPQALSALGDHAPGALDVAFQDALGTLPETQVRRDASDTVTLSPTSGKSGVRGATFTDPVSGEAVWVEYRDGKGLDANAFYASAHEREEIADWKDLRDCKAEHGEGAVECNTLHRFRP